MTSLPESLTMCLDVSNADAGLYADAMREAKEDRFIELYDAEIKAGGRRAQAVLARSSIAQIRDAEFRWRRRAFVEFRWNGMKIKFRDVLGMRPSEIDTLKRQGGRAV
jgi:hypothetical protein